MILTQAGYAAYVKADKAGTSAGNIGEDFSPSKFSASVIAHHQPELTFKARNRTNAEAWQRQLRAKLINLLGGFPSATSPLNARITDVRELVTYTDDGRRIPYRRESVVFYSRKNLPVFAYFLWPLNERRSANGSRLPCIICLPAHGTSLEDVVGVDLDGSMRKRWDGYQRDFPLQCVAHGYPTFVVEQLGFGRRKEAADYRKHPSKSQCRVPTQIALLLGQSMIGWRTYDVVRAVDYVCTRREIDPRRIAVMGVSAGGTTALFAAAIDRRLKCTVICGYLNTFRDSLMSHWHCICNIVPGISKICEMYDIAGLIAPGYLFCETATQDVVYPVEGARQAFQKARRIYNVFRAQDNVRLDIWEGKHGFSGRKIFAWLQEAL